VEKIVFVVEKIFLVTEIILFETKDDLYGAGQGSRRIRADHRLV